MTTYLERVDLFIQAEGLDAAGLPVDLILSDFRAEMEAGLAGRASSLAMIPTYISVDVPVPPYKPVIALDAGGTHLRIAQVEFDESGNADISHFSRHRMPGSEGELAREAFFARFVELLQPLVHPPARIGFCFSYPAEISPARDGRLLTWTKEIKAPQVEGEYIGRRILQGLENLGRGVSFTLLNDTVAALLAGKCARIDQAFESYVGFILGTGTNSAYVEKQARILKKAGLDPLGSQAVNVESGNFDLCPRTRFDKGLDAATNNPGAYRFEKMISGAYLGRLCLRVLKAAARADLFSRDAQAVILNLARLSTIQVDKFMENSLDRSPLASSALVRQDRETILLLLEAVIARAACLSAVNIASAVLKSGAGRSKARPVCVNIEGSTYYGVQGLQSQTEAYLKQILLKHGRHAQLVRIPDSSLIGAAVAGLTQA